MADQVHPSAAPTRSSARATRDSRRVQLPRALRREVTRLVWLHVLAVFVFVVGTLGPELLFDLPAARTNPWLWGAVHGLFLLAAGAVSLTSWRLVKHERLHDAMTGLRNRTDFAARVGAAIEAARPFPIDERAEVAVLFVDIDAFRQVNEQFGLSVGDAVLPVVGARLREAVEPLGSLARYGGDEFTVLLPAADQETIEGTARRIRRSIEAGLLVGERELRLSVTIGIATAHLDDDPVDTPDTLVRNAETAMLMAKQRNAPHEYFDPSMRARLIERLRLRQDLEIAVESGAIQPAFQPIVQLESGLPIAVEALARWTHPDRGPVSPVEFIAVAEETDLILRIGRRIIADSCLRLGEWQRNGLVDREFMVSVNLSTRQLEDPSLVAYVMAVIDEARIDPHCLILELTETAVLQDSPLVVAQIEALRGIGVRLAIDDFGTGYSSLNYLRQMPIQILKIDRSFVEDLDLVLDNRSLVGTILSLGEGMDLRTVAEGIERDAQVDVLRALGCRYGQGYLFSRPLDAEAIVTWLVTNQPGRQAPAETPLATRDADDAGDAASVAA